MEVINFLKKKYYFKGKNILITGANGALGFKLAKFFYNSGSNLILTDIHEKIRKFQVIQLNLKIELYTLNVT